jgi:hypothetical protein
MFLGGGGRRVKVKMGSLSGRIAKLNRLRFKSYAWASIKLMDHGNLLLFLLGTCSLISGLNQLSHAASATTPIDTTELLRGTCTQFYLIEGPYGALLATNAGLGAIVSAAFGQYRAAYNFLIVSISSFILRSMVSMWFGVPTQEKCKQLLHMTTTTTPGTVPIPGPTVPVVP